MRVRPFWWFSVYVLLSVYCCGITGETLHVHIPAGCADKEVAVLCDAVSDASAKTLEVNLLKPTANITKVLVFRQSLKVTSYRRTEDR